MSAPRLALYDHYKGLVGQHLRKQATAHGKQMVGVCVEGSLAAIAEYLRETRGSRAAFEVLTRHAEAVIAPELVRDTSPTTRERP